MGKIKQNKEIIQKYYEYNNFLNSGKTVSSPVIVSDAKGNHGTSLYSQYPLQAEPPFGNTSMTCEVRNGDHRDCSFQILSDAFAKRVVLRYDTGGGTHKNDAPHIPLAEQSVTTPHFHKYDSNGYFLAYKTDLLNDPKQAEFLFDLEFGFPYFCQEGKIFSTGSKYSIPEIKVIRDGCLPFKEEDTDPLEGINF